MSDKSGIFVVAELTGDLAARIAAVQRKHDPRLALLWSPHVTLLGSSGAGPFLPDTPVDELRSALLPVAQSTAPVTLAFGHPVRFPGRDIVVLPLDPHGPLRELHEALRASRLRTYQARYPFTPHCTLTMYPPLSRERERKLLALRLPEPFVVDRLRILLTRFPQPAKLLLDMPLGGGPREAPSGIVGGAG
jgi:2'-5' RNA ligase